MLKSISDTLFFQPILLSDGSPPKGNEELCTWEFPPLLEELKSLKDPSVEHPKKMNKVTPHPAPRQLSLPSIICPPAGDNEKRTFALGFEHLTVGVTED